MNNQNWGNECYPNYGATDKLELQQMGKILARVKKRLTAILNYG